MQDTVSKKEKSQNKNKKVLFGIVLLLLLVAGGLTYYFWDSFSQSPKKYDDDISKALRGLYNDKKWEKKFEEDYKMDREVKRKNKEDAEKKSSQFYAKTFDYLPKECQEKIREAGKENHYKYINRSHLEYQKYDLEDKYKTLVDDCFMNNDDVASCLIKASVQEKTKRYWWDWLNTKVISLYGKKRSEKYEKERKEIILRSFLNNVDLLSLKSFYENIETHFGITNTKKKAQTEKSCDDIQQSLRTFYKDAFLNDHIVPCIEKIKAMTEEEQKKQRKSMKKAYEKALWKIVKSLPSDLKVIDDMKKKWHVKKEDAVEKKYIEEANNDPLFFLGCLSSMFIDEEEEAMDFLIQNDAFWFNVESFREKLLIHAFFVDFTSKDKEELKREWKPDLVRNYCDLFIDTKATIEFLKTLNVVQGEENNINQEVSAKA